MVQASMPLTFTAAKKGGSDMATVQEALDVAVGQHTAGRLADAEAIYRQILDVDPVQPVALHLLGVIAHQVGRDEMALELIGKAIAIHPDYAEAHGNLGTVLRSLDRVDEALAAYRKAVEIKPDFAEIHLALANLLTTHGRLDEAVAGYARTIALKPDSADAHNGQGLCFNFLGRVGDAAAAFQRAIDRNPDFAEAHSNLCGALRVLGRTPEAIASARRAIALRPTFAEAHANLAVALQTGWPKEAMASYRTAMALKPDFATAMHQMFHHQQVMCDWTDFDAHEQAVLALVRHRTGEVAPFTLLAMNSTPAEQLQCARDWTDKVKGRIQAHRSPHPAPTMRQGKIRLGYLSGDFRAHAVAYQIVELFERHDRSRFEVIAYSYGDDDGSAIRRRLVAAVDEFIDIAPLPHDQAARRIRADGIDILVDLKGYTGGTRSEILVHRPTPIQVNYLGYPGTMGADFIDYIVVDPIVVPVEHQPFFTEALVHLPHCYMVNDSTRPIAKRTPHRRDHGLPARGFVFCCFNNSYKITPRIFDVWMRLLAAVPGSVLWLMKTSATIEENLTREAVARGLDPSRLVFAPKLPSMADHLARHRLADLFLDTLPYNAHSTASDALWAGLPVLTCLGESFAGRVAAGLLHAVGLDGLTASSLAEYEALALRLARQPGELAALTRRLRMNRTTTPLFDTAGFATAMESALERMWDSHCRGNAPRGIVVTA